MLYSYVTFNEKDDLKTCDKKQIGSVITGSF